MFKTWSNSKVHEISHITLWITSHSYICSVGVEKAAFFIMMEKQHKVFWHLIWCISLPPLTLGPAHLSAASCPLLWILAWLRLPDPQVLYSTPWFSKSSTVTVASPQERQLFEKHVPMSPLSSPWESLRSKIAKCLCPFASPKWSPNTHWTLL